MQKSEYKDEYYESNINISEIVSVLWKDKISFVLLTLMFSLASVFYSLSIPNKYESSSILQISGDEQDSSIAGLSSQYGGLASLAGISLPSSSSNKSDYVINTLKSREFLKHLLTFEGIKENLMAVKSYDLDTGLVNYDEEIFDGNKWVRKVKKNQTLVPSYLEVHQKVYLKNFSVGVDLDSGFISLSFEHLSPVFAKEFLDLIIKELNLISKQKDLQESETAFNYLENQLLLNPQLDIRNSINQLIASQLKSMMLANVKESYIISPIDPPYVAEYKSSPDRFLICVFGSILGIFIAFMISIIRYYFISDDIKTIY
jgi:uncharacterized protein involved in exopolysaccharide biosynthesis